MRGKHGADGNDHDRTRRAGDTICARPPASSPPSSVGVPGGTRRDARRRASVALRPILAAAACLLASVAAQAAGGGGFVIEARGWQAAPRGDEVDYAFIAEPPGLSGGGTLVRLEGQRSGTEWLRLAWSSPEPDRLELGGQFWQFDQAQADGTAERPQGIGALLASPDFAIGRSLVDRATASRAQQATVAEVYVRWRPPLGESGALDLWTGLRRLRYESSLIVNYELEQFGVPLREIVNRRTDLDGWGPFVRFGFERRLSRLRVAARLGAAFLSGDDRMLATDTTFIDGDFDRATVTDSPSRGNGQMQVDGTVELGVDLGQRWTVRFGWAYFDFGSLPQNLRFVDDVSQNTVVLEQRSLSYEGLYLGLAFRL